MAEVLSWMRSYPQEQTFVSALGKHGPYPSRVVMLRKGLALPIPIKAIAIFANFTVVPVSQPVQICCEDCDAPSAFTKSQFFSGKAHRGTLRSILKGLTSREVSELRNWRSTLSPKGVRVVNISLVRPHPPLDEAGQESSPPGCSQILMLTYIPC